MHTAKFKVLFFIILFHSCVSQNLSDTQGLVSGRNVDSNQTNVRDSGRTLDSLGSLANFMLNLTLNGMNYSFPPSGNTDCPNNTNLIESLKIPLYLIFPAVIIGVVILIKKIGLFVAWIPSVTAPWFKSFKSSFNSESDGDGGGWGSAGGYPSPSPAYGPPAPSSAYGYGSGSTNSRQTAILESIDNLNNQYGPPPGPPGQIGYQAQPSIVENNNAGDYSSDDAQNYMSYYYNQPQVQPQVQPQLQQQSSMKLKI